MLWYYTVRIRGSDVWFTSWTTVGIGIGYEHRTERAARADCYLRNRGAR